MPLSTIATTMTRSMASANSIERSCARPFDRLDVEARPCDAVIAQNPKPLQDLKAGRQAAMGALVGMIMKTTKGLNPKVVQERLRHKVTGS